MTVNSPEVRTVQGRLRDLTAQPTARKLGAGEIAVVDTQDMPRRQAELLVAAKPAAVVNLQRFSSGTVPNYGTHLLLDASIPLVEAVGGQSRTLLRNGKKATIAADGTISVGKKAAGVGEFVDRADVDASFAAAQEGLIDHMEAYFGNTIEFIRAESPLLVDGVGVPELGDTMAGRKVLVVAPEGELRERLSRMRNFIREYSPVIIGVGVAADTLVDLGHDLEFIVGDPADISAEALRSGARVILPADPDGHAAGLERIQDLGVGAMTFPAATQSPTDLAILLAAFHDAELIVTLGGAVDLDQLFAAPGQASPAALLARLKAGRRLVDASVIEELYRIDSPSGVAWAWAILGLLVAVASMILIVGLGGPGEFGENLADTWAQILTRVQGWFD
ncbi:putative cytokinetic ring protein SteA [Corynebacterium liangguodongii]|uniref:Thiamine pyrophosphokinase n=1 Tax=Corynebacterium liangguodongii TaxID=2079535 RepID=A0A2S0WDW2_9CORY|nr:putative cytokinetic ring protein SteA [Corynebacterium liangguodongii]AWB83967.1 thiamine pyrophosphokinase [Corynebacterium liangguodongii]PWB99978.1 thiamine pyrophosphokinase [Corynebacterium liangguodongii]